MTTSRFDALDRESAQAIYGMLAQVAHSDGAACDAEAPMLKRAAEALGLDDPTVPQAVDEEFIMDLLVRDPAILLWMNTMAAHIAAADGDVTQSEFGLVNRIFGSLAMREGRPERVGGAEDFTAIASGQVPAMIAHAIAMLDSKNESWREKKNVAASLAFELDGTPDFLTATNYKLSTPTGSRCAEQNAIGMAIARHPELTKADFTAVVVVAQGFEEERVVPPCGVCLENLRKLHKKRKAKDENGLRVLLVQHEHPDRIVEFAFESLTLRA